MRNLILTLLPFLVIPFIVLNAPATRVSFDGQHSPPDPDAPLQANFGGTRDLVIASRVFAAPGQLSPSEYEAYGMLVFGARPTSTTRDRFEMLCTAFLETIPHRSELTPSELSGLVTIWPMTTPARATLANRARRSQTCALAIDNYGLPFAQQALEAIRNSGQESVAGLGPFLVAWKPGAQFGSAEGLAHFRDLSRISTPEGASQEFSEWMARVQRDSDYWQKQPWWTRLRESLRQWADHWGPTAWIAATQLFSEFKSKG